MYRSVDSQRDKLEKFRMEQREKDRRVVLANDDCKKCGGTGIVGAVDFSVVEGKVDITLRDPVELLPCVCLTGFPLYNGNEE